MVARFRPAPLAALALFGCAPASVFTSARALPRGKLEHLGALEVSVGRYEDEAVRTESVGLIPSYGLRGGLGHGVEVGAKLSPFASELHAKITLYDAPHLALAVAPRAHSGGWFFFEDPFWLRAPLLVSAYNGFGSFTPRLGPAFVVGEVDPGTPFSSRTFMLRTFALEFGATAMFDLTTWLRLAVDGYLIASLPERQILMPGGGIGLLFGAAAPAPLAR